MSKALDEIILKAFGPALASVAEHAVPDAAKTVIVFFITFSTICLIAYCCSATFRAGPQIIASYRY